MRRTSSLDFPLNMLPVTCVTKLLADILLTQASHEMHYTTRVMLPLNEAMTGASRRQTSGKDVQDLKNKKRRVKKGALLHSHSILLKNITPSLFLLALGQAVGFRLRTFGISTVLGFPGFLCLRSNRPEANLVSHGHVGPQQRNLCGRVPILQGSTHVWHAGNPMMKEHHAYHGLHERLRARQQQYVHSTCVLQLGS
jgi:hypothetical protein